MASGNNMKCPFCGSDPEVLEKSHLMRTKCNSSAQNIELILPRGSGRNYSNVYKQTYYIIRCSNKNCLAYHLKKSFWSEESAYEMWNRR